jgi:hypothetical protein
MTDLDFCRKAVDEAEMHVVTRLAINDDARRTGEELASREAVATKQNVVGGAASQRRAAPPDRARQDPNEDHP